MALIKCTECGRPVSDKASSCPNCGCPVSAIDKTRSTGGTVRIRIPGDIVEGAVGLFSSRNATIVNNDEDILWKGKHGETASFDLNEPTQIQINLGGWANEVIGEISPWKSYSLVQDMGMHLRATYRLSEVDVIDSD